MKRTLTLILGLLCVSIALHAQETFPRNGVKDDRAGAYAFTHATLVADYQNTIEDATLLVRDGKVEAVGKSITIPDGYIEMDLDGQYIYPSLIDMYTHYGQPEVERARGGWGSAETLEPETKGPYNANDAIKAHYNAFEGFETDAKAAGQWRKEGFGTVLSFRPDGLARGTSMLITLADTRSNKAILQPRVAAHYSFDKGSSSMDYPGSAMGYVSLLRQTYIDADWYAELDPKPFVDRSLEAWIDSQGLPQIFEVGNWHGAIRADRIGDEFGVQYLLKTGGDSYQRLDLLKETGAPLIVPVAFPEAFDVSDPIETYRISYQDLKHWELAPANLAKLEDEGFDFALTAAGLKDVKSFHQNVRKAIELGLSPETALKALTETPARLLGVEHLVGSLASGMVANFIITSGPLFEEETVIYENWVQGKPYQINDRQPKDLAGVYALQVSNQEHKLEITGKPGKQKARIVTSDSTSTPVNLKVEGEMLSLGFDADPEKAKTDYLALSGWTSDRDLVGSGQKADGSWLTWKAEYEGEPEADEADATPPRARKIANTEEAEPQLGPVTYPFTAYGMPDIPEREDLLIRNATVWTMEEDGVLEETDLLIRNGKIAAIGKNLPAGSARVIDGTGKHVSPGIIDEHSHIGAFSINERITNSGMVRIGDVINSEDIEIYRALSGGVTAIQILHGSANPIGGQSALIKLRWGHGPEQLKIEDADGYIKFALGENVKRSRSNSSIRYPGSRMGVEQVFVDAFTAARDYEAQWKAYDGLSESEKTNTTPPRRDLALEAMVEILNKERFISCHSYVQSEINMLMKVAERFDFNVNTFTHILEGYKVADKMAEHGVGGSTFSDWWAYKWEVRYAIPYNAALMHREGVVTAINSDDAEMMRRLNQEAAKSVKYGGLSEEEAMAMVTINPAKLLHLDDRTGSLKVGKDADVVVWSDHPLSIYARPEQTIVDGTVFFDVDRDQALKQSIAQDRARIIAKMREENGNGGGSRRPASRASHHWHCDDLVIYRE